jgi:hypothetical protein
MRRYPGSRVRCLPDARRCGLLLVVECQGMRMYEMGFRCFLMASAFVLDGGVVVMEVLVDVVRPVDTSSGFHNDVKSGM